MSSRASNDRGPGAGPRIEAVVGSMGMTNDITERGVVGRALPEHDTALEAARWRPATVGLPAGDRGVPFECHPGVDTREFNWRLVSKKGQGGRSEIREVRPLQSPRLPELTSHGDKEFDFLRKEGRIFAFFSAVTKPVGVKRTQKRLQAPPKPHESCADLPEVVAARKSKSLYHSRPRGSLAAVSLNDRFLSESRDTVHVGITC